MTRDRTKSYYRTKANKDPSHKTTNRHCQKRGTREDPEKQPKAPETTSTRPVAQLTAEKTRPETNSGG